MITKRRVRPANLHVQVGNDVDSGEVLADVDAPSTAQALAYFLQTRGYDPEATEGRILADEAWDRPNMRPPGPRETLVVERRSPFSGALEWAFFAKVDPDHCDYCRRMLPARAGAR